MYSGIYIHLPICKSRCIYCDFYSQTNPDLEGRIVESLLREIELTARKYSDFRAHTLYLGGGTPSFFADENIGKLLRAIISSFTSPADDLKEITIEMNPDDVDLDKLNNYKDFGINRISLGVQSFDDKVLQFLKRRHNANQSLNSIELIKESGFTNFSIDLIFAIPNQTITQLRESLESAIELKPSHISLYCLTYEPLTELHNMLNSGVIAALSDDTQAEMFREAIVMIKNAGYRQYELSNFARPGYECRHNLVYWKMGDYLGFGPSAHSLYKRTRWANYPDLKKYADYLNTERLPRNSEERLSPERKAEEYMMLSLRLDEGIELDEYRKISGVDLMNMKKPIVNGLIKSGLAEISGKRLRLTLDGAMVADEIIAQLI
ncbi:MAG: radical SAM family heme chaperone HemW [candidate division Zixibacteria bacterium]|nr:radical SAM family heme chaperone HemW [candidate division Zixibacteria bacterium]